MHLQGGCRDYCTNVSEVFRTLHKTVEKSGQMFETSGGVQYPIFSFLSHLFFHFVASLFFAVWLSLGTFMLHVLFFGLQMSCTLRS